MTAGEAEGDFVFWTVKPDARLRYVVCDDEVAAFAKKLVLRVGDEVLGFGCEADEEAVEGEQGADGAEDVLGAFEFEGEGGGGLFDFLGDDVRWAVVGHGGAEDGGVAAGEVGADGVEHFAGGFDVDELDTGGWREGDRAGDEEDFVPGGAGGFGEGVAHAAGGAVGEEAHGVDGLARGAGGDEEAHGGFVTWSA